MKIIGATFEYRKELSKAGLAWNAADKSWDGELNSTFAAEQVRRALESGKLREISKAELRNGPGRFELDNIRL